MISFLKLSGNLVAKLILVLISFFGWFLHWPFYKILTRIYYQLFRFRKTDLGQKTARGILQEKLVYFFILLAALLLIAENVFANQINGNLEMQAPKTVMANLIKTEFANLPDEKLIEETATPDSLITVGKEKYSNDICFLQKESGLPAESEPEQFDYLDFSSEGDLVFKPSLAILGSDSGSQPVAQRQEIVYYTIQAGDTVSSVAQRFNVSVNTILWANNMTARSILRIGDRLTILPYSGVLYTVKKGDTLAKIAKKYGIEVDKILSCNNLGNTLIAGQKIVLPGAKKISDSVVTAATTRNYTGISAISGLIKSPTKQTGGGKMAWPTVGYRITQYYSWRHTGLDIGNKTGTPVYAADDGVVEFAGWATGYGYSIVINHGGGVKTRYGHASKLFVKVGEEVERGENIMAMGSTGWSTGPHLHFEVIISGKRYNPLNYIK